MLRTSAGQISWSIALGLALACGPARGDEPLTVGGFLNPQSVAVGPGGQVFVAEAGVAGRMGDGLVSVAERSGRILPFAVGLDDPGGMVAAGGSLFVADRRRIWRVAPSGEAAVFAGPESFPRPITRLDDLALDGRGGLFVSDAGNGFGAVYRVGPDGRAALILDGNLTSPQIERPGGLLLDDVDHLFVGDSAAGHLYRFGLLTGTPERIGSGFGGFEGIARGPRGRLFLGDGRDGVLFSIVSELEPTRPFRGPWRSSGGLAVSADGRSLIVPDPVSGTVTWLPLPGV